MPAPSTPCTLPYRAACARPRIRARALLLPLLGSTLLAQWEEVPLAAAVPNVSAAAMAGAPGGGLLLLGMDAGGQNRLWRFSGAEWQQLPVPFATLQGMALAFDRARNEVVLFGGTVTPVGRVNDTWTFDGSAWTQRTPLTPPSARANAVMAYDVRRGRTVLFGGQTNGGLANDTFEWDGSQWSQAAPSVAPPQFASMAMVFDEARQELALLGTAGTVTDFWVHDGTAWQQPVVAVAVPQLLLPHLAYDRARARVVAHGGGATLVHEWDGRGWFQRPASALPPPATAPVMGYDEAQQAVVLHTGGRTFAWLPEPPPSAVAFGAPCVDPRRVLRAAPGSVPSLGRTLRLEVDRQGASGAIFGILGLSRTAFGGAPLPTPVPVLNPLGCLLRVDVFMQYLLPANDPSPWLLPIPNSLLLLGATVQTQALVLGPLAIDDVTNGLALRAGVAPAESSIRETFATALGRDGLVSGDAWGGGVVQSIGLGGDGRHGSFDPTIGIQVAPQTYDFSTDSQLIPASRTLTAVDETVTNGQFQFTDFVVPAGVTVRFRGSQPAVVRVRGQVQIDGVLDADAPPMPTFNCRNANAGLGNLAVAGQQGGLGGPGGARGGGGGDRCLGLGPSVTFDGKNGQDVLLPAGHAYAALAIGTGGRGAPMFPAHGLNASLAGSFTIQSLYNASVNVGGGGGGFAAAGGASQSVPTAVSVFAGPASTGGQPFGLLPLPPGSSSMQHFLVGGSGGGGGGSHPFLGANIAVPQFNNDIWKAGAGGTGGGGAVALRSGGDLRVGAGAELRARGGRGAAIDGDNPNTTQRPDQANQSGSWGIPSPGGGGSGGSWLLQSRGSIAVVGTMDASGGVGSRTVGMVPQSVVVDLRGGDGSAGALRLEAAGSVSVTGTSVPVFTAANTGPLLDRDASSGSRSVWLSAGTFELPTYRRYELRVDVAGLPLLLSDDPAIGPPADGSGAPVRVRFQAARLLPNGTVDPASIGPWRDYAGSDQAGFGIGHDRGDAFRFDLVLDNTLGNSPTVRSLAVFYR